MGTMLIVEDDADLVEMIDIDSHKYGVDVLHDSTGSHCISIAKKQKPDIILLDLNLPTTNGLALLNLIKKNPDISSIPVIVFSAHNEPEIINAAMELGADAFFVKGTPLEGLFDMIRVTICYREPEQQNTSI